MGKKFKRIGIIMLTLVLLSGCNLKQKIGENITEGIIEKATGGEVEVEIDGDEVTYQTEEGETVINTDDGFSIQSEDGTSILSGSEYEWPTEQAAAYLPKLDVGTVTYILNSDTSCMVSIENVTKEDYQGYKEAIAAAGYTKEKFESSAEDFEMYSGSAENGIIASVMYTPSASALQVTLDASGMTE